MGGSPKPRGGGIDPAPVPLGAAGRPPGDARAAPPLEGFTRALEAPAHRLAVIADRASPSHCQPPLFIPGETPLVAGDDGYSQLADATGEDHPVVRVLVDEPVRASSAPGPGSGRRIRIHEWSCDPSDRDFVIAVHDGDQRVALFTHVRNYRLQPGGPGLLLINYTRSGTSWTRRHRLVDLDTLDAVELPVADCIGWWAVLDGDGTFTEGASPDESATQRACFFAPDGTLRARGTWPLDPLTRSRHLSMDPPVVAVLSSECTLVVADLSTGEARVEHDPEEGPPCPTLWERFGQLQPETWRAFGQPTTLPEMPPAGAGGASRQGGAGP